LKIFDKGSTNGTFINGQRLKAHEPKVLEVGNIISIGKLKFEVIRQEE
jgi:pSer/pThr/pTyr-binding forkhead associated (FHA) protein